ncbi:hypothetical protein Ae201684_014128 [Aphanomyces euteiches]|uniref:Uncharacterized protein n=1 Tax=Aphanomyces euteiches TaxID=100861 RepID=A0A6G0WL46_9STRA|nr:hypothetical protein Ae201684_014128 [Aphanomyces euteiches]
MVKKKLPRHLTRSGIHCPLLQFGEIDPIFKICSPVAHIPKTCHGGIAVQISVGISPAWKFGQNQAACDDIVRGQGNLQGRLQLARNTRLVLTNSSTVTGMQTRVGYQHYEPDTAVAGRSSYLSSLVQDLRSSFPSSRNLTSFFSSYAPRTTKDKLTQNQPWDIWNYQGQHHTTGLGRL